ncbi:MAG TPA: fatty acid desaturase [Oculatellaceae cyanobacterium]
MTFQMATNMVDSSVQKKFRFRRASVEWPTVFLGLAIYAAWLALTYYHARLPGVLVFMLGGMTIAWQSSFQHEVVHGHPTRWWRLNRVFGFPPLSLWLPFEIYRTTHRLHHIDSRLTDPYDDPESKYLSRGQWHRLSLLGKVFECLQVTLVGRILLGPFSTISKFLWREASAIVHGDYRNVGIWLVHGIGLGVILIWLVAVCHLNLLEYMVSFLYPGTAILMLRSFAEHRASERIDHRTAIIESKSLFAMLFLNNNLHFAHHKRPLVPWYLLPRLYEENKESFIQQNGGLVYSGYSQILRRFLWRANDSLVHPLEKQLETQLETQSL